MSTQASYILENYEDVLVNFYKEYLVGCKGQYYTRLYLDLTDYSLFVSIQASSNTWLHRDDGSLIEVAHDAGWGVDLTADELVQLEQDGVFGFGYFDYRSEMEEIITSALASKE